MIATHAVAAQISGVKLGLLCVNSIELGQEIKK